jgi:hypothetical protein
MARTYRQSSDDLQIKWKHRRYYFDVIPREILRRPVENKVITHAMYWDNKDREEHSVKATLSVKGSTVVLDYIGMNHEDSEVVQGKVIIRFTSSSRSEVKQIDWQDPNGNIEENVAESNWHLLGEVREGERYLAEAKRLRRNPALVKQRKRKDNFTCQACGYKKKIANISIVDCHHLRVLSETGKTRTSINDLITLCPNCHRIAHSSNPPLTVSKIKKMLTIS